MQRRRSKWEKIGTENLADSKAIARTPQVINVKDGTTIYKAITPSETK